MNRRSLMRSEMVHTGEPSEGCFGMFSTCTLSDGAKLRDLRTALQARGAAFTKASAKASTHMRHGGIGIPNALQGAVIVARLFSSIEAWGQGYEMYFAGDFSAADTLLAKAVSCGPVRTYIGTPFYVAAAD